MTYRPALLGLRFCGLEGGEMLEWRPRRRYMGAGPRLDAKRAGQWRVICRGVVLSFLGFSRGMWRWGLAMFTDAEL
jgi:hypothetical protein